MKKTLKVITPLVVLLVLYLGVKTLTKPKVEQGQKSLQVVVYVRQEDDSLDKIKTVDHKTTQATTLGEVLDELDENMLKVETLGSKTDEYGRMLVGLDEIKTEDMAKGPWWMLYSETNEDCLAAGFCSGIDSQSIQNDDVFEFIFE